MHIHIPNEIPVRYLERSKQGNLLPIVLFVIGAIGRRRRAADRPAHVQGQLGGELAVLHQHRDGRDAGGGRDHDREGALELVDQAHQRRVRRVSAVRVPDAAPDAGLPRGLFPWIDGDGDSDPILQSQGRVPEHPVPGGPEPGGRALLFGLALYVAYLHGAARPGFRPSAAGATTRAARAGASGSPRTGWGRSGGGPGDGQVAACLGRPGLDGLLGTGQGGRRSAARTASASARRSASGPSAAAASTCSASSAARRAASASRVATTAWSTAAPRSRSRPRRRSASTAARPRARSRSGSTRTRRRRGRRPRWRRARPRRPVDRRCRAGPARPGGRRPRAASSSAAAAALAERRAAQGGELRAGEVEPQGAAARPTRSPWRRAASAWRSSGRSWRRTSRSRSWRRRRLASVASRRRSAFSLRLRYLRTPAASSMIARRSSGRALSTASIWPWLTITCCWRPTPVSESSSWMSSRRHGTPLMAYSLSPVRNSVRVIVTSVNSIGSRPGRVVDGEADLGPARAPGAWRCRRR